MALEDRTIKRNTDDSLRHLDRILSEVRDINNSISRLGADFRNDRRFSQDSYRLNEDIRQIERDTQRTRERLRDIQRKIR